jgi:hypothetical protein
MDGALRALEYAIDNGALISNNSWGGAGYSEAMELLIADLAGRGHIVVASAGNGGDGLPP